MTDLQETEPQGHVSEGCFKWSEVLVGHVQQKEMFVGHVQQNEMFVGHVQQKEAAAVIVSSLSR